GRSALRTISVSGSLPTPRREGPRLLGSTTRSAVDLHAGLSSPPQTSRRIRGRRAAYRGRSAILPSRADRLHPFTARSSRHHSWACRGDLPQPRHGAFIGKASRPPRARPSNWVYSRLPPGERPERELLMPLPLDRSRLLKELIQIGISLTSERDLALLPARILTEARRFTQAEAGTLYLREGNHLRFIVVQNDVLARRLGERELQRFFEADLPLREASLAGHVVLSRDILRVSDAY